MIRGMIRCILGKSNEKKPSRPDYPEGDEGIEAVGHREYVGGLWDEIGRLQFDFLKQQGLAPHHAFVDVACGSLRAGVFLIPYLDRGNYLGIDKEQGLVDAGIEQELNQELVEEKAPEFVISDAFEFEKFSRQPDFGIAQSLFTHLVADTIEICLKKLRASVQPGCQFYTTFFETDVPQENLDTSHDHKGFYYTKDEMASFGEKHGWSPTYIGDWNHPRDQKLFKYTAV